MYVGAHIAVISVGSKQSPESVHKEGLDQLVYTHLSHFYMYRDLPSYAEMSLKWMLNAITTGMEDKEVYTVSGAHIIKGKVFQNMMIDVGVSNNKLFHRAVGIISQMSGTSSDHALECLLKSIYEVDTLSQDILNASVSAHIERASKRKGKIVPLALVLAFTHSTVQEAKAALQADPIVRKVIAKYVSI